MGKQKKREFLRSQAMQAKQATINRKGHLPDWENLVIITAQHWKVSCKDVNREMVVAMIRHRYTDYESQVKQLSKNTKDQAKSKVFYEAAEILRRKANQLANGLYEQACKKRHRILVET